MFCLSLWKKSTLTPLTPHFFSSWNSSRRMSRSIHQAARLLGDEVVRPAGVVPEQQAHALFRGVPDELRDRVLFHQVPVGVDQRVLPAHLGGQIDEIAQGPDVPRARIVRPPPPRNPAGTDPLFVPGGRGRIQSLHQVRLDDRGETAPVMTTRQGVVHGSLETGFTAPVRLPSPSDGMRIVYRSPPGVSLSLAPK